MNAKSWLVGSACLGLVAFAQWVSTRHRHVACFVLIATIASVLQHLSSNPMMVWVDRTACVALAVVLVRLFYPLPPYPALLCVAFPLCAACDLGLCGSVTSTTYTAVHLAWHVTIWLYIALLAGSVEFPPGANDFGVRRARSSSAIIGRPFI